MRCRDSCGEVPGHVYTQGSTSTLAACTHACNQRPAAILPSCTTHRESRDGLVETPEQWSYVRTLLDLQPSAAGRREDMTEQGREGALPSLGVGNGGPEGREGARGQSEGWSWGGKWWRAEFAQSLLTALGLWSLMYVFVLSRRPRRGHLSHFFRFGSDEGSDRRLGERHGGNAQH